MSEEKKSEFTVTDRRKFTLDGDPRPEPSAEEAKPAPSQPTPPPEAKSAPAPAPESVKAAVPPQDEPEFVGDPAAPAKAVPPPPSAAEQQEQANRYQQSSRQIDSQLQRELESRGQRHQASDFEITFEKFMASLYMTALLQLGLVHEQGGQPAADLIGARQTIDTISMLSEKTKGNLTPAEQHMLQNVLYELRMAYVEVTNALTHPPAGAAPSDPGAGLR